MNAPQTIAVAIASAVVVTLGSSLLTSDRTEESSDASGALSDLALRVEGLAGSQEKLAQAIAELEMRPVATSERNIAGELEDAIERYLASRAESLEETSAPVEAAAPSFASLDLQTILATLEDPDKSWMEKEELWQLLREEGRLDEVIAEYERLAGLDPNNPDRKVELGYAYIQKIQEVGQGALAGKWAALADEQFDAALALDEMHWDARFTKAMALSHWPAFAGKTAETIAEFEKLIEIQDQVPVQDDHLNTYLVLGNIYMGQGKNDLAISTWQKGLGSFPGNESLLEQIEALQGQ